jgi:endonuclease/exonuclease/phosphatase family metal-dependent hydrolase
MTRSYGVLACALLGALGCGDDAESGNSAELGDHGDDSGTSGVRDGGAPAAPQDEAAGEFLALTYNVAGLPMGLSSSMPELYTPLIGPLLNDYDMVLLQESWQTPDPNPGEPLRVYHEILVELSEHPYKSEPAAVPWGTDPDRPEALLGDGLNMFSEFPFGETMRVRWATCVATDSDCLALKGFSATRMELAAGVAVDVYNLHMEAGGSPEDDAARALGIEQMIEFIAEFSEGRAVIMGGDFNLHTDREPAATQFARLLDETGLHDACAEQECDEPGSIDKFLFRGSALLELSAESHGFETDVFVADDGMPLSDHDPLAVRFAWATNQERD